MKKSYGIYCYLFFLSIFAPTLKVFGGAAVCTDNGPNANSPLNGRLSQSTRIQTFDASTLNLKPAYQSSAARMQAAISITLADFNAITSFGNSWLLYQNQSTNFSMNIGSANNASPQTWALPTNLLSYFEGAGRSDFINPNTLPLALQVTGENKTTRTLYYDYTDRPMKVYDHYYYDTSSGSIMNHLGTSYDMEVDIDKNFDEPDYEMSSIPLALGNSFSSTVENEDYLTSLTLIKYVITSTVDAYGTITTPTGTYDCLRISVVRQKYTRPSESAAYSLVATENFIEFMTKEGELFGGKISSTSETVTVSNIKYRRVVPTAQLSESNDVKLNNDSKGVTINNDNDTAHPSAILDIKNDSLGVLIPRIAVANRPSSPATGLLVYQIDNTPGFYYYNGTGWRILSSSPSVRIAAEENSQTGIDQLENGTKFVKFETLQENPENLIIQIQPEGDCNGLFITQKTKEGFWVNELQKGKSNVKFTWSMN